MIRSPASTPPARCAAGRVLPIAYSSSMARCNEISPDLSAVCGGQPRSSRAQSKNVRAPSGSWKCKSRCRRFESCRGHFRPHFSSPRRQPFVIDERCDGLAEAVARGVRDAEVVANLSPASLKLSGSRHVPAVDGKIIGWRPRNGMYRRADRTVTANVGSGKVRLPAAVFVSSMRSRPLPDARTTLPVTVRVAAASS